MSSYWVASDKIPIEQKSVRIPAENGTDYIAGQEIRLRLDPTLKFFNPEETYLEFKVKINPPTYSASGIDNLPCPTRLSLDHETGGQCLVRSLRIHDNNGVLLEEIENYNTLVALKYDYQTNESLKNKRAMTEGTSKHMVQTRGTFGNTKSDGNNWYNSTYSKSFVGTAPINASFTTNDFNTAKLCMPLHSGILSSDKIFPNMLLGGITITLLLEDNNRVFRLNDGVMRFRRLTLNPKFKDASNSDTGRTNASVQTNGSFDSFRFDTINTIGQVASQCPFVVGEKLGFQRYVDGNASVVDFANASHDPVVKVIRTSGEFVEVELNSMVRVDGKGMTSTGVGAESIFCFSKSVGDATNYDATYTISDVNLIVQQVMPPASYESTMMRKMKEGGTINYDFNSFTTYKYSQLSSDRVANIRLPINNSRCKSILCVPTDATVYTTIQNLNASTTYIQSDFGASYNLDADFILRSNRSGLEGIVDEASNYQWLYDGRLQPNRRVSLTKVATTKSIDAQHLIELDKALSQASITGHSFAKFNKNFVIGRALALGDAVYDARNKDFSLQVNYENTTAPSKNKLWLSFVAHIRRIEISGNSVQVIV
jgi:hypothetical protein